MATFTMKYIFIHLLDDILQARVKIVHISFLIRVKFSDDLKFNMLLFTANMIDSTKNTKQLQITLDYKTTIGIMSEFDKDTIFKAYIEK